MRWSNQYHYLIRHSLDRLCNHRMAKMFHLSEMEHQLLKWKLLEGSQKVTDVSAHRSLRTLDSLNVNPKHRVKLGKRDWINKLVILTI